MSGCSPKCNGGLAYDPRDFVIHLPLILARIFHVLTRKHEVIGSRLERGRRNRLPLSCLCVLSDIAGILQVQPC